jgi:hypothetical protein
VVQTDTLLMIFSEVSHQRDLIVEFSSYIAFRHSLQRRLFLCREIQLSKAVPFYGFKTIRW